MQVKDILKSKGRDTITTSPDTKIRQAMELLIDNQISCLPVVGENGALQGIISDKDIFRMAFQDPEGLTEATVGELMTTNVIIGLPEDEVGYIAGVMTNNRIRHIPIVEQRRLVGLISVGDVVKTQMENIKVENRYLWQYIEGSYPG
jgi:CBS-domain-containing membrane protein